MKKYLYIGIGVIAFIFFCWLFPKVNRRTITATVNKTERIRGSVQNGKQKLDKYLIYTLDKNDRPHTFENTDTWIWFKFNSSDVYAKIQDGETYDFSIVGFRIPILSMYPNIIKVEKVNQ
ncbi:DUF1523 family protein [Flammeovirga aprica]|uniref:DUF1523 family protein n=1 Tax=Flammeovirga aprica JL-4 TaxID=694437 RepID=A0A7X9P1C2_9BACT|nr:DUF1523 family protein [Flammeovirga aprica]NME67731.1 DUF1523 family protein [Flammeovirga aprica JL-4]